MVENISIIAKIYKTPNTQEQNTHNLLVIISSIFRFSNKHEKTWKTTNFQEKNENEISQTKMSWTLDDNDKNTKV